MIYMIEMLEINNYDLFRRDLVDINKSLVQKNHVPKRQWNKIILNGYGLTSDQMRCSLTEFQKRTGLFLSYIYLWYLKWKNYG